MVIPIEKLQALHNVPGREAWKYLSPTDKQISLLSSKGISEEKINLLDRGACAVLINKILEIEREVWAHGFPDIDEDLYDKDSYYGLR